MEDKNKEEAVFYLNSSVYPLEAILATCYVFLEDFYFFLDKSKGKIKVALRSKGKKNKNLSSFQGKFMNELLNNSLRYKISKRNQKIREYVVKTALFFSQDKDKIDKFGLRLK